MPAAYVQQQSAQAVLAPPTHTALQEAARVLKTDGVFLFNIWDSFEHSHFARTVSKTIVEYFPVSPPDFFNTPYGYHDIDDMRQALVTLKFRYCREQARQIQREMLRSGTC
ncbi:MAG: spermidine synthase [Granulosicoccus sp.]|jgi:spermidine synthase